MNDKTAQNVVTFVKNMISDCPEEIHGIEWFGGEPLLRCSIISRITEGLLEFFERKKLRAEIVTNGSLICESMLPFFVKNRIDRVHITLDGMGTEYEKRKNYTDKNHSFNRIIDNILLLHSARIPVMIRINIDRYNKDNCKELITYLNEIMDDDVEIHVAPLYGLGDSYLTYEDVFTTISKLQNQIDCSRHNSSMKRISNKDGMCKSAHMKNYLIKPNGDIIRCEHLFDRRDAIIGSVYEGISDNYLDLCSKCDYYSICKQGCHEEKNDMNCSKCWKSIWA